MRLLICSLKWAAICNFQPGPQTLVVGVDSQAIGCPFLYSNEGKIYTAMTVVTMQEQTHMLPTVPCVICQGAVPSHHVTTGSLYADGSQAYACQQHMRNRLQWLMGWLHFERAQGDAASERA